MSELATLEHRLAPTAERELLPVLMMLLAAFPAQSLSPDMAELRAEAYRTALGELPAWAVRAAVVAWLRGEAEGNLAFAPSPPELRKLSIAAMIPVRAQATRLRRLMEAATERAADRRASSTNLTKG